MTPIKPYLMIPNKNTFQVNSGVMNLFLHLVLTQCFAYHKLIIRELPVFAPNNYLFENFKHLGKEKSDIYKEAVKEIMSQAGGFKSSNASFLDKLNKLYKFIFNN